MTPTTRKGYIYSVIASFNIHRERHLRGEPEALNLRADMDSVSESTPDAVLSLRSFSARFGDRRVLREITLDVPARGVFVVMGPGGAGKSTLLRTISGLHAVNDAMTTSGTAHYRGDPLGQGRELPGIVTQNPRLVLSSVREYLVSVLPDRGRLTQADQDDALRRLFIAYSLDHVITQLHDDVISLTNGQRRLLCVLRATITRPALICIDEPTADLGTEDASMVLALIERIARERAVLMVTHNQDHARRVGDRIALLVGGRLREVREINAFFESPDSEFATSFIRSGSCATPIEPPDVEPTPTTPRPASTFVSESRGPRGFRWIQPGKLGGTPRPGIVDPLDSDLAALRRVGIDVLVTLTEQRPFDDATLHEFELDGIFFPIVDMETPELDAALHLCVELARRLDHGEAVALHCKAGLGRTGTMAAAQLIFEGLGADEALRAVRRVEPKFVQSTVQEEFLTQFQEFLAVRQSQPGAPLPSPNNHGIRH